MKKIIFSGIKPSGDLHIGNYLGAISQWIDLQNEGNAFFCIVDQHAITVPQEPKELYRRTIEIAKWYLAFDLDHKKSVIFAQSHVPAHTELGWILNTLTPVGELQRMTQYKDAIAKGKPNFGGLLNYPTLMAADILLYQTNLVPVGEDQVQHVELARSIAERFNNRFGETFEIPKEKIVKEAARVMSLTDPTRKMAKSDEDPDGALMLSDSADELRRKIKKAVTDSGNEVKENWNEKPGITNLLYLFSQIAGKSVSELEKEFDGKSYVEFKESLAEAMVDFLSPPQKKFAELDEEDIMKILSEGAFKASEIAQKTLRDVKEKMGFVVL